MYPFNTTFAGRMPAPRIEKTNTDAGDGARKMKLIQEALSRARMRRPQAVHIPSSEAPRPARQIAREARRRAAREQGIL